MKIAISGSFGVHKTVLLGNVAGSRGLRGYEIDMNAERKILHRMGLSLPCKDKGLYAAYQTALLAYELYRHLSNPNYITETPAFLARVYAEAAAIEMSHPLYALADKLQLSYDLIIHLPITGSDGVFEDGVRHADKGFQREIDDRLRALYETGGVKERVLFLPAGNRAVWTAESARVIDAMRGDKKWR